MVQALERGVADAIFREPVVEDDDTRIGIANKLLRRQGRSRLEERAPGHHGSGLYDLLAGHRQTIEQPAIFRVVEG